MSTLKPYPAYKDSGIEWLGQVPEQWLIVQLRNGAQILNGGTPPSGDPSCWGGDIPFISPPDLNGLDGSTFSETARFITAEGAKHSGSAPAGSVMLSTRAPVGHIGISRVASAFNQGCRALVPADSLRGSYLAYALVASREFLVARATGTTFLELSGVELSSMKIPLPRIEEQCAIADFLDRETAEIDEFVAESEKLMTLLNERRTAVITQAVTKGLDPTVPMKDTGIEGVGQVPSHWRVARISWLFGETASGTTPEAGELVSGHEADIPWVTSGELREANLLSTSKGISVETLSRYSALTIHPPGSLLIAMYGATIGRMCILGVAAASNQAVCALRHPIDSNVSFVLFALLAARERLLLDAAGGGQPNINQDKVRAFRLPVPDKVEQDEIVAYLSNQTAKIDEAIETAREAIALAKERRQALISAAVTGKIDVRAAA